MTATATPSTLGGTAAPRPSTVVAQGAAAGAVAGLLFIAAMIWFTDSLGMPGKMPLMMMAAMVQGESALMDGSASPAVGALVHAVLSIAFGITFGLLVSRLRATPFVVGSLGLLFGLLLYVVSIQVVARAIFPWMLDGNQPFSLVIHVLFGALVAVPFLGDARRAR